MPERKAAIYSRKSRYTGKGESIENQVELCRAYVRTHFGEDAAKELLVFEDEGFSGGNLNRPQFRRMMAAAGRGELSAVVVYRLDRISRNIGDFAGLIQELCRQQISFVSIREQFDTQSPMGRAMMYIASVFSQLERETTAERIRDNLRELAKTGRWLGGTTPAGFASEEVRRVTVDGRIHRSCRLKELPEEAAVVRRIFRIFLETGSLTQIDALLLQTGCVTRRGNRFTRFSIRGILANPVYLTADEDAWRYLTAHGADLFSPKDEFDGIHGMMAYNRTIQQKGRTNRLRPVSEWIVAVGQHPGLVSGQDWVAAQRLLEQNGSKRYRGPRSNTALLSGLVRCGGCGAVMRTKLTGRRDTDGEEIFDYLCTLKERSKSACCRMKNIRGNGLDRAVEKTFETIPEDYDRFLRRMAEELKAPDDDVGSLTLALSETIAANDREIAGLLRTLPGAAGTAAERYVVEKIDELHRRGEQMKAQLVEYARRTEEQALSAEELGCLCRKLGTLGGTMEFLTLTQKRTVVRSCVQKIVWDGETAHIYLLGAEDEASLPREDSK